ncbi:transposase, MuDR, MULE transposase domain protein, partial [Tanacetum coccineum]
NILNRGRRERRPSIYRRTPYMDLPPTTVLPKKRGDKTKNKVKNANVSPLNLGNAFADDNVGGDDVMFLGECDTGNYLVYENVDPSKVWREDYIDCMEFLLNPYDVYLDCHMMGYMVPDYFWRQLVPHLCMPGSHSLERPNQEGWLSGDHMNAWIELLIRERTQNANWTVSKSGTVCVHPENKRFMIQTDQHIIGTLDGSTRPYPTWNDVDWVYMPINAGGNHWVTGAVNLPNSLFYVFDSMHSEGTRLMLEQQIRDWTPVINGILQSRGCFNGTGRQPHNFLFIYNDGLGHTVPQQPNFKDCGVITCWLIAKLCSDQPPIVHGDSQAFWENIRYQMLQMGREKEKEERERRKEDKSERSERKELKEGRKKVFEGEKQGEE